MNPSVNAPVDFLIITALQEERDAVLSKMPDYKQTRPSNDDVRVYFTSTIDATFSDGTKCAYSIVVVCLLGMARVQAVATSSDAIRRWGPRNVLLVGIAGGLESSKIELADILIANLIVDYEQQKITGSRKVEIRWNSHQVDTRLLEYSQSLRQETWQALIKERRPRTGTSKTHVGPVATGDKVIAVKKMLDSYKKQTWPKLIGVEMEAGGVAVACHQSATRPGFFMIRCVSDLLTNKNEPKVESWRPYACDVAASFAFALIQNGPILPAAMPAPLAEDQGNLREQMAHLTFSELSVVTDFLIDKPARTLVDFALLNPDEKLQRNNLTSKTRDLLIIGLSKRQLVSEFVEHTAKLHRKFPDNLKAGFLAEYRRLRELGLQGDDLFDALSDFASRKDGRMPYRAGGLAVLTYLFELCDVFEK